MDREVYGLLGIAMVSNNLCYGEKAMKAITSGSAQLVVLAQDSSSNSQKKITDKCRTYGVKVCLVEKSSDLSMAIGKGNIIMVAVMNGKLAKSIQEKMK